MSDHRVRRRITACFGNRYTVPVIALVYGVALLVLQTRAGSWIAGVGSMAIMSVFAAIFLFGGRSDLIRGLRGDGRDERIAMIDLHATAISGLVLIIAVVTGFLVELARGNDGAPYIYLGAIAGITYLAAIAYQQFRS